MRIAALPPESKKSYRTVPDISKTIDFGNFLKCIKIFVFNNRECFIDELYSVSQLR